MATFEVKYSLGKDYENRIEIDVRLKVKPTNEDIASLMGAVETLDQFAKKWVELKQPPVSIKKPGDKIS